MDHPNQNQYLIEQIIIEPNTYNIYHRRRLDRSFLCDGALDIYNIADEYCATLSLYLIRMYFALNAYLFITI